VEEENARMTTEQLKEFGEALSILSAKSSVLQERDELRNLMQENLMAEEVAFLFALSLYIASDRIQSGSKVALGCTDEAHPNNAHKS
jgi:hypothetical protein